jgi:hypothetical protein
MARLLRWLAIVFAASLFVTVVAGRFTPLSVLGWAVFFGSLFWNSLMRRDSESWKRCRP